MVYQDSGAGSRKRVNQLFKADFFGEGALLSDEPRWVAGLGACLGCGWVNGWEGKLGRNTPGKHKVRNNARAELFPPPACLPCLPACPAPSCRAASVEALTDLVCLTLDRATFTAVLGPLQQLMSREKSPAVVTQRLMRLQSRGGPSRVPAEVLVRRQRRSRSRGTDVWEVIRARGHLDEVLELHSSQANGGSGASSGAAAAAGSRAAAGGGGSGAAAGEAAAGGKQEAPGQLVLTEGNVLGGGAFSRVSVVSEQSTGRTYALKRMRKSAVVQCPEHVFCEQTITRNLTHPFCIRQYASFQVGWQAGEGGGGGGGAGLCGEPHQL